jgi:SpoVK/Ycf46/Vps4 family AAA+-type ATPase
MAMTFADVATTDFFPLHRLHSPVVVTPDGVDPDVGLLTGPVALAAVLLDAVDAMPPHMVQAVVVVYASDDLEDGLRRLFRAASPTPPMWASTRYADDNLVQAIQYNETIVGIAEVEAGLPEGLRAIADVVWRLPDVDYKHVAAAIRLMTGVHIDLPRTTYLLKRVLLALKPGHSAPRIVADLARLHPPVPVDDTPTPPPAPKKDAAVSLTDAGVGAVTRLRDLTGYGDARTWGLQLADDLRAYDDGALDWADVDKGLLLSGPPGCGKTFYAAALAAECDAQLITTSYSQWHTAMSGDSVQKSLIKLFADVRKAAKIGPVILFVDELDSIGKRGLSTNGDYWYGPIINSWLAFLDGAEPREGIVVIAATNRPEMVDDALQRPGRLEKHIIIPRPSITDLGGVLQHHLGTFDGLDRAARDCRGMSCADVAQVAREVRRAARRDKCDVAAAYVSDIVHKRRGDRNPAFDRVVIAHEAGHALVALRCGLAVGFVDADQGVTAMQFPAHSPNLDEIERTLTALLAGRAAEIVTLGCASTGAVDDLAKATGLAMSALQSGLLGSLIALPHEVSLSLTAARQRVEDLLGDAMDRAIRIVKANRTTLDALITALASKRYLDAEDLQTVLTAFAIECGVYKDQVDEDGPTP